MVVEIKRGDTPEDIRKKLQAIGEKTDGQREETLKPYFGILDRNIDPVKLQKQWRDEWE